MASSLPISIRGCIDCPVLFRAHTHTPALQQLLLQVAGKTVQAPRAALLLAREASPPPSPRSRVLFNEHPPANDNDLRTEIDLRSPRPATSFQTDRVATTCKPLLEEVSTASKTRCAFINGPARGRAIYKLSKMKGTRKYKHKTVKNIKVFVPFKTTPSFHTIAVILRYLFLIRGQTARRIKAHKHTQRVYQ